MTTEQRYVVKLADGRYIGGPPMYSASQNDASKLERHVAYARACAHSEHTPTVLRLKPSPRAAELAKLRGEVEEQAVTRCKYCRAGAGKGSRLVDWTTGELRCFDAYECRDRMRDRERRVVRVFWRARCATGEFSTFRDLRVARRHARNWTDTTTKISRVTVRRKVKA